MHILLMEMVKITNWLVLCWVLVGSGIGHADQQQNQRKLFLAAEQALAAGDRSQFDRFANQLKSYPLHSYLRYAALQADMESIETTVAQAFLDQQKDAPLANRFRKRWLAHLAKHRRWGDYLRFYDARLGTTYRCHAINALLQTGQRNEALQQVESVWLHGRSQPSACDPVFEAWRQAGKLTGQLVWQRIALAMDANQTGLAKYLGRYLSKPDRVWLNQWRKLHGNPEFALDKQAFAKPHPYRTPMLAHAVKRQANRDAVKALRLWRQLGKRLRFNVNDAYDVERRIALNLVRAETDEGYAFLDTVQPRAEDTRLQEALLQAALYRQDWPKILQWTAQLPSEVQSEENRRYWYARALEATGDNQTAARIYLELAGRRSYYGFLAADRVTTDYHLEHVQTPVAPDSVAKISTRPAVLRARELRALSRWIDARREWRYATKSLNKQDLMAAAVLAESWGWHDQAIFTLAKTHYWDDLELRFPVRHRDTVTDNAQRHSLDPAWVFAVVRQESAFMEDAHSRAGARGLMQLMPATARLVAKKVLSRKPPRLTELYEPDTNIGLGTAYLRRVLNRLGDHPVLATAAYNAGPHRVERWLPDESIDSDIWIEVVPFRETRGYLRRVMAYTVIYEKRLGIETQRLSDRMRPVQSRKKLTASREAANKAGAG